MNKLLIIFGIGVLVIIVVVMLTSTKESPTAPVPAVTTTSQTQPTSRYLEYSPESYAAAASQKRVFFFYATWCPTCKVANEDFLTNPNKIPQDVAVIRVNYNDPNTDAFEKDLAKKHGITYQHTFVQIDAQGNQITKWNGGQTEELMANIK